MSDVIVAGVSDVIVAWVSDIIVRLVTLHCMRNHVTLNYVIRDVIVEEIMTSY